MQNSLYTDLIDEFPTLRYDRVRSVRSWARLADLTPLIFLDLQCSTDLGPDGRVTSLRVIGLCLSLRNVGRSPKDQPQFLAWLIKTFHSKLAEFPHLRVAEINSDLRLLQWATEAAPDISQLPTLAGGQLTYRWGCPKEDFKSVASEGCVTVGVDPVTLEPSGMCTAYFTSCGETEKCDFQDFFGAVVAKENEEKRYRLGRGSFLYSTTLLTPQDLDISLSPIDSSPTKSTTPNNILHVERPSQSVRPREH